MSAALGDMILCAARDNASNRNTLRIGLIIGYTNYLKPAKYWNDFMMVPRTSFLFVTEDI